jgi:glycine/D-amino acid oxidase-like deaminating enzyme
MDFLRLVHAKGRYLGMETELITPSEAKAMFPLMDESNFVGALWDPVEGHLDPSGTTHAYARAAKKLGAEIVLRNRVIELTQEPTAPGTSSPSRARSRLTTSSMPAASGRAKSAAWSVSNCRFSPWSTCIS